MTVTSGFFDSVTGDRTYNASQFTSIFDGVIIDGIFQNFGGAWAVTPSSGLSVSVASGRAWFLKTWTLNDSAAVLTHDAADVILNRIDIVALEIDLRVGVRANKLTIVKGTPGSVPVPPTLLSDADHAQYPLAQVSIPANLTTITAGHITNKRGTTDCPWAAGLINAMNIHDATELTILDTADEFAVLDASASYILKKMTWSTIRQDILTDLAPMYVDADGYVWTGQVWTYVSGTSFSVPGNQTALYTPGLKIKCTNASVTKYFYVVSSAYTSYTTVTITGGSDYTLSSGAISDGVFSRSDYPKGFPLWMNYTPSFTGFSSIPTAESRFSVVGRLCTVTHYETANGTSNSTAFTVSAPIKCASVGNAYFVTNSVVVFDNGVGLTTSGRVLIAPGGTTFSLYKDPLGNVFTASNGKRASFTMSYEI